MKISQEKLPVMISLAIGLFFLCACAVVTACGLSNRVYSDTAISEYVPDDKAALEVWREHHVRGRTLLLFDCRLNAETSHDTGLTNENYVDAAISDDIVRRIIHVVPEGRWREASGNLLATGVVSYSDGVFSTTVDGAPLQVLALGRLSRPGERVLVHVNSGCFDGREYAEIKRLLAGKTIDRDILTFTGTAPSPSS